MDFGIKGMIARKFGRIVNITPSSVKTDQGTGIVEWGAPGPDLPQSALL